MAYLVMAIAASASWAEETRITGLRSGAIHVGSDVAARLVVETSAPVQVSMLLLTEPYRLVMDFKSSRLDLGGRGTKGALQTAPLLQYRYGKPDANTSRLVIDLAEPAVPLRAFRLPPREGRHRFVVDLLERGETAFRLASQALLKNQGKVLEIGETIPLEVQSEVMLLPQPRPTQAALGLVVPIPRPAARQRDGSGLLLPTPHPRRDEQQKDEPRPAIEPKSYAEKNSKWVVFIDAGHGGKDPGAIGISGQKEKDVTLKAALELARQLKATGKVKPVLSRDRDVFHKLRKRINLARSQKADVFISLHADAAPNRKAKGVSVFTLSEHASDKEAARLASRENKADLIGGPDLDTTDPLVTTALLGMFQRESMNQSSVLAHDLIMEFSDLPTPKRGHRFAGFAVLKSPDIPSVLIEMGFLTNKEDEQKLKNSRYLKGLMARVTKAVLRYLEQSGI